MVAEPRGRSTCSWPAADALTDESRFACGPTESAEPRDGGLAADASAVVDRLGCDCAVSLFSPRAAPPDAVDDRPACSGTGDRLGCSPTGISVGETRPPGGGGIEPSTTAAGVPIVSGCAVRFDGGTCSPPVPTGIDCFEFTCGSVDSEVGDPVRTGPSDEAARDGPVTGRGVGSVAFGPSGCVDVPAP